MKKILVIPDLKNLDDSIRVAKGYNAGFEYNDFMFARFLDDEEYCKKTLDIYKDYKLPSYTTNHGAFIDVLPYSTDKKVKEISIHRINQSIEITRKIGANAVVIRDLPDYSLCYSESVYKNEYYKQDIND